MTTRPSIAGAYALARQAYADVGVDTEAALARLDRIPISIGGGKGAGGRADELRADADAALAQLPGPTRFTLHAGNREADAPVEPDAIRPELFQRWLDWARARGIGLDLRASSASLPDEDGRALGPLDPPERRRWIAHCQASRAVCAHLGRSLGTPSVTTIQLPDGPAGPPLDGFGPRRRLAEALEEIFATPLPREHQRDAVEGGPSGRGAAGGSSDFCLAYAVRRGFLLGVDGGPLQSVEIVAGRLAAALQFVDGVLLHLPAALHREGERVALLDGGTQAVADALVRGEVLERVALCVDLLDTGVDRIPAWVLGARGARRALLRALLEPGARHLEAPARLALLEQQQALPWPAVWAHYCESRGAPPEVAGAELLRAPRRAAAEGAPADPHPVTAAAPAAEGEAARLFRSEEARALKERICDIGRRLWQRAYVDGNGGNVSVRLAGDLVLCTPTLVSKGFMRPEDLCLVDMGGVQRAGATRMTSEIHMHLAIYRAQPLAKACVHAHPPHATGFAVANVQPVSCLVPEMEVFCGEVPVAPYSTPGSPAVGESVARLCDRHNTVLMGNHGAVAWGFDVQDAYFKMEILESYCRTVLVALKLGGPSRFTPEQLEELLAIKRRLGIPDARDAGGPGSASGG